MSTGAKNGESTARSSFMDRLRRPALLVLGIWTALCGGTLYGFSAFEVELMDRCQLSARQLDVIYSMGQLGVGCGLVPGAIYDACGPRVTFVYALVLTSIGNAGLALALQPEGCTGMPLLAFLFFVLQNGSAGLYQAGLFANIRSSPPSSQGMASGIVAAGYGLSAALWSVAYQTSFGKDASQYFAGTGVIFAVTSLVAAISSPWLTRPPDAPTAYAALEMTGLEEARLASGRKKSSDDKVRRSKSPSPTAIGRSVQKQPESPAPAKVVVDQRSSSAADARRTGNRQSVCVGGATGGRDFRQVFEEVADAVAVEKAPNKDTVLAAGGREESLRQILGTAEFWIFAVTFASLQAVGSGMFIGNLALMAKSLSIKEEMRLALVRIVSYCNCAGRFLTGVVMDFCEPHGLSRVAHTIWTAGVMLLTLFVLYSYPKKEVARLFPGAMVAIGFVYGANWSIMPSFLASRFGTAHVGKCFNIIVTGMACIVTLVSYRVGSLYDAEAKLAANSHKVSTKSGNLALEDNICLGKECFQSAFSLGLGLSFVGLLAAVLGACCAQDRTV